MAHHARSWLALALAAWPITAFAQPEPPADAGPEPGALPGQNLEQLVSALGNDDYATRAAASALLKAGDAIEFDTLIERAARPDLTPEQRERLVDAAHTRFIASPAPGMGVSAADLGAEGPVQLATVRDGFPVADFLRVGDVIYEAYGLPIRGWDHFRAVILSHVPGESFPIRFYRENPDLGEPPLELAGVVELGRFEDLGVNARVSSDDRSAGFFERLRRAELRARGDRADPAVAGSAVTQRAWLEAEGLWPPPDPGTPIGQSGLPSHARGDLARAIGLAGQADLAVPAGVIEPQTAGRLNAIVRRRGVELPWAPDGIEWTVVNYRLRLEQIALIERQFNALDMRNRRAEGRAANLREQFAENLREVHRLAERIERDAEPEPDPGSP